MGLTELVLGSKIGLDSSSNYILYQLPPPLFEHRYAAFSGHSSGAIRTPDAIQIATAMVAGTQSFITNDKRLCKPLGITILVLDDFLNS